MKYLMIALLLFSFSSQASDTVEDLNLLQYIGKWNELASIPQSFSRRCVKNSTAEYFLLENGNIRVVNSCEQADGSRRVAEARARVNKKFNINSKLEVTFVKFIGWIWAFRGDYWVIGLDQDYQWAVVGNPDKDALWILARKERLNKKTLKHIRSSIENDGYDSCQVMMSEVDGGDSTGDERLCDLKL